MHYRGRTLAENMLCTPATETFILIKNENTTGI